MGDNFSFSSSFLVLLVYPLKMPLCDPIIAPKWTDANNLLSFELFTLFGVGQTQRNGIYLIGEPTQNTRNSGYLPDERGF